jgi:hypothetical protein
MLFVADIALCGLFGLLLSTLLPVHGGHVLGALALIVIFHADRFLFIFGKR